MAEYIDKQIILDKCQRLIDVERKQGSDVMNYGRERVNQTEVIMEYIEYMTPTADVIERSEYDRMVESFKTFVLMKEENVLQYRKANKDLRSKIDKTIEELERYSTSFEYANRHDLADAVDYCIEIIQRNIGEDKDND